MFLELTEAEGKRVDEVLLKIEGAVRDPLSLTYSQLKALPDSARIPDLSEVDPRRAGAGLKLSALLELVAPLPEATHLTFHSSRDHFSATVPLDEVRSRGVLIYALDGEPLPAEKGGPVRFLVPNAAACQTAAVDACANVKFLDRIELTSGEV